MRHTARSLSALPLLFSGAVAAAASGSTIVVSTLPDKQACCGEAIGAAGAGLQTAVRFVPNADYSIESVTFDLVRSFGGGLIVAQIYSERDGLPGTLLYSITASEPAPESGGLFTIAADPPVHLLGGTAYWLTATNTDPDAGSSWWYSDKQGWRAVRDLPGESQSGFPEWGNASGGGPAGPGRNQTLTLSFLISGTRDPSRP